LVSVRDNKFQRGKKMKKLLLSFIVLVIISSNIFPQANKNFTAAFDSLHKKLSVNYAFTDWKNINWANLYSEFRPRVAAAEAQNDSAAFFLAIKEYLYRIHDGHVNIYIDGNDNSGWGKVGKRLRDQQIGGSYGFTLIKLDDGRFVVRLVTDSSAADLAGIKFGADVLEVNDMPVSTALDSVPVIWAETNPTTKEAKQLYQCRLIGRAPVGATIKIKFKNRGDINPSTQTLTAVYDNYATYDLTTMSYKKDPSLFSEILQPSGYGYLQLTICDPSLIFNFITAFEDLLNNNVKGIVFDLRINRGGSDAFAAAISGFFYTDTTFYEYWSFYDPVSGTFQITKDTLDLINLQNFTFYKNPKYPIGSIYIEPPIKTFKGPVVVMDSPRQVSSGEGIAMALKRLPQCKVISFYGSHGSFGIEDQFELFSDKDSVSIMWAKGRSLDSNKVIQVDSDSSWTGGVTPDIRPPLNDQIIDQMYLQGVDVELEYAIQQLDQMTGVKTSANRTPVTYFLSQNYPNPFNPSTTISYQLPAAGKVTLKVFDILGREITTLVNEDKTAGNYKVNFNGSRLGSGIYFYQLRSGSFIQTKKLVLLK
jgi:carboxyl-terminal processing protease